MPFTFSGLGLFIVSFVKLFCYGKLLRTHRSIENRIITPPLHMPIVLCTVASVMSNSYDPMDCSPPGSSVHGILPGKNTGVGCHFLLQGIFQTQGSNPRLSCLLHGQKGSLPLAPPGKLTTQLQPVPLPTGWPSIWSNNKEGK